ncbi:MAG: hypothetical protein RRE21_01505 [Desulfurococcales archaeon]|jgi:hypothetical protein|nr:hypothetical protein [Desulfurococcaceae archaeon]MDT7865582.1 hypothetical protein [Desulfurococcales archaeon]
MSEREKGVSRVYEGSARVGRIVKNFATVTLKPEDFSSPVAFQMAISRIYESMIKMFESGGPKPTYVAEVRFTDDLGNSVVFAVDLGSTTPPFSGEKVKARIYVEIYEEE